MASAAEQLAANMNFSSFAKAKELQQRILFTVGILIVYRIGTFVPIPGIDPVQYARVFEQFQGGILNMFNTLGGGADLTTATDVAEQREINSRALDIRNPDEERILSIYGAARLGANASFEGQLQLLEQIVKNMMGLLGLILQRH